jgi:hypothetical protein
VITHLDVRDRRADRLDHTGALVAEHNRRRERDGAVEHADVAVTKAGLDPHQHLAGTGIAHLQVVDDLRLAAVVQHTAHLQLHTIDCSSE